GGVVPAENVALAGAAAQRSKPVAAGDVAHVDDVEAAAEDEWVLARDVALDEHAGGRGRDVAAAERKGRIDDDDRQTVGVELERLQLADVFADDVVVGRFPIVEGSGLVGTFKTGKCADRRDGARVDHAPNTAGPGRAQ